MATPNLEQISKELSFKIFDPVASGTSDGKIFTSELRLGYINRAYSSLVNIAEALNIDKTKVFKNYYSVWNPTDALSATGIPMAQQYEVYDLFYAPTSGGTVERASYIDPENFYAAKHNLNSYYAPSTSNRYWTIIDSSIAFLPVSENWYDMEIFVRDYFPEFTYGGATDLELPSEYKPLVILMAAIEAMADKGDQAKYSLYTNALDRQTQLLGLRAQKEASISEEGGK